MRVLSESHHDVLGYRLLDGDVDLHRFLMR